MKLKLNTAILGSDGINAMTIPATKNHPEQDLTLKTVCIRAVLTPLQSDDEKTKQEKYDLWKKIISAKEDTDFTIKEVALMQKHIGLFEPQLIMGQCNEMLEAQAST